MSKIPPADDTEGGARFDTVVNAARGLTARLLAWVVGGILGVAGSVRTIQDYLHHHRGVGPYLLAAGFLLLFLAVLDMWRVERARVRKATRSIRQLSARVDRHEENVQHLEHDRDQWRRMQAEEALANRRLTEALHGAQRTPQVSGGSAAVASTGLSPPT